MNGRRSKCKSSLAFALCPHSLRAKSLSVGRISDDQVFDAAIAVMQQDGYAGATTKKIAKAAGIHEVTLFRRFESKAALLSQVMKREAEAFGGKSGFRCTGKLHSDLVRVVSAYAELVKRRGRLIPVLLSELPRHPELASVIESPRMILSSLARMIQSYQARGELLEEDPMLSVCALIAPLLLPSLMSPYVPLPDIDSVDVQAHVRAFLNGRAPSQAP